MAVRNLAGVAIVRRLWRTERAEATLAAGAMSEFQVHGAGVVDDDAGLHARLTGGMTHAFELDDRVTLNATTYFQARADRPENWRIFQDLNLTVALSERFSATYSASLEHDREPLPGLVATDVALTSSLNLTF
jgi:hypothetical protein